MVAVPSDTAVTTPLAETVATEVLLDVQVTFFSVALVGEMVTINCSVLSANKVREDLFKEMLN